MADPNPITDAAAKPKSASVDNQSVQQRDIRELIEADRAVESNDAAKRPGMGIRMGQFRNRGTA